MKGIIINLLEKLIIEKFGDEVMEEIYEQAEFSGGAPPFIGPGTYPDSDLFVIVELLSQKTNLPVDDLVYEFGKYVFPVLAAKYPVFIENVNSSLDFLMTLDNIHDVELKKLYEDATPPTFKIEEIDAGSIKLHYFSQRKLCRLLEGLLEGVANYFREKVSYSHQQCMKDGYEECLLDIKIYK